MLFCFVLCCAVLCCSVLFCFVLFCFVLCSCFYDVFVLFVLLRSVCFVRLFHPRATHFLPRCNPACRWTGGGSIRRRLSTSEALHGQSGGEELSDTSKDRRKARRVNVGEGGRSGGARCGDSRRSPPKGIPTTSELAPVASKGDPTDERARRVCSLDGSSRRTKLSVSSALKIGQHHAPKTTTSNIKRNAPLTRIISCLECFRLLRLF